MREVGLILCNVSISFVCVAYERIDTGLIYRASRGHSRVLFRNSIDSTVVKEQLWTS